MKLFIVTTIVSLLASSSAFVPITGMRSGTKLMAEKDEMSKALPFATRPKILDGSLPGDVGFE